MSVSADNGSIAPAQAIRRRKKADGRVCVPLHSLQPYHNPPTVKSEGFTATLFVEPKNDLVRRQVKYLRFSMDPSDLETFTDALELKLERKARKPRKKKAKVQSVEKDKIIPIPAAPDPVDTPRRAYETYGASKEMLMSGLRMAIYACALLA